jgi:hypothetical protein
VFAGQNLLAHCRGVRRFLCLLSFFVLPWFAPICRADSLEDAARALARKVAAVPQRYYPLSLSWQNWSSVPEAQLQLLRESFVNELGSGVVVDSRESNAHALRVFLQDTPTGILLVAAVPSSNGEQIRMIELPRSSLPVPGKPAGDLRLQKELIWQQREPILDAIEYTNDSSKQSLFLLLTREAFWFFRGGTDGWVLQDSKPIPLPEVSTRDSRGQIRFSSEHEDRAFVDLPGRVCDVRLMDTVVIHCESGSQPWGEGRFLTSPCTRAVWWLQADSGDWTTPDRLLLRNPGGEKTDPFVAELELPGPVMSISAPGKILRPNTVVVHNLSSGNYEVYRITLACGD